MGQCVLLDSGNALCKPGNIQGNRIRAYLLANGHRMADSAEEADTILLSLCMVTGEAEARAGAILQRYAERAPRARLLTVGCAGGNCSVPLGNGGRWEHYSNPAALDGVFGADPHGEASNGVALTNNLFDPNQPAFYINVQVGDVPVVRPPLGIVPDQFLYFYAYPNQPTTYLAHSTLVAEGETVLSPGEVKELGKALKLIHQGFSKLYSKPGQFYAMDVEFKFDPGWTVEEFCADPCPKGDKECDLEEVCVQTHVFKNLLWVKQARPHYGWSANPLEE